MKILISNKSSLDDSVTDFLKKEGSLIDSVKSLNEASEKISLYEYDCILININSSAKQGWTLLEELNKLDRKDGVVIISNTSSLEEKIKAFELGADDFLTEPIELAELNARIKAIVRRKKFQTKNKVYFANLVIDLELKQVQVWDVQINFTKKEYEILLQLIANKNRVLSKESLGEYLWGENIDNIESFDFLFAHIKNLKKKLIAAKAELEIRNIYKLGYQIIEL